MRNIPRLRLVFIYRDRGTVKLIGFLLTTMLLAFSVSHAQEESVTSPNSLFTFTEQADSAHIDFSITEWQTDSQSFRFSYHQELSKSIFQFFLATNEFRIIERPGLCAFVFSEMQAREFAAVNCPISISPNKRYVVYPIEEQICGESCSHLLALGDLETDAYATIRKGADSGNYVRWSEDSSAFLIMDYGQVGGIGGIWYGTVPMNVSQPTDLQPTLLANFGIGDIGFVDISPDGQQVLIRGDGKTLKGLTLWDKRFASSNQQFAGYADGVFMLENQLIAGASFVPGDNQYLLVVVDQGIVLYDLYAKKEADLINTDVNAQWAYWIYFSPDISYALAYGNWDGGNERNQLVLFRIER